MGAGREDAPSLTADDTGVAGKTATLAGNTASAQTRPWPIVVRRAREADRSAVLAFATNTWKGHDYIPNAWPVWLDATDGAFLVATVGEPGGSDAEGKPLEVGAPIAITRVAMVSDREAWLEGIRVHPKVRGIGVASDLQVAELHWIAAQEARVVRYATSSRNEASHRLGARDGIETVARFRSWWWPATGKAEGNDDEPSAFDTDIRQAATALRQRTLKLAGERGLVVNADSDDVAGLWQRLDADPTFAAGQRLYEARSWAFAELTRDLFARHLERGEVLSIADGGGWAVAILMREQMPSEDSALRFALLAGDGRAAIALADQVTRAIAKQVKFRVPAGSPLIPLDRDGLAAAGFVSPPDWELHILARRMDSGWPIPAIEPARLVLSDPPHRLLPPTL